MSATTINLQSLANVCSTHMDLMPLSGVGGYTDEPFLTLANDAIASLLMRPHDWTFNQTFPTMLVTALNKQDYIFGGATAFTLGTTSTGVGIGLASNNAITESGTTVTVQTLETHRFKVGDTVYMTGNTVSAYNSTFTDDGNSTSWTGGWAVATVPTATSFTFTHTNSGLANSGAPGITDFGWLQAGSMVEMNNNSSPQNIRHLEARRNLVPWSRVSNPQQVAVIKDYGNGTVLVRFNEVPGSTIWGVSLVYQAKAPLKTSLFDTISPFPDHFRPVVLQALFHAMYRYLNSPRAEAEYQKLQQRITEALGYDESTQSSVYVTPEDGLMDSLSMWG
jgi:hypothetical protein